MKTLLPVWCASQANAISKIASWLTSISLQSWLFVLVIFSYAGVFLLRLRHHERTPGVVRWLPPLVHLAVWSYLMATVPTPPPLMSAGWGLLALVLIACPLLFDHKEQLPEWLTSGYLFAGLAVVLWVFLFTSTTSSAAPAMSQSSGSWQKVTLLLLTYAGVGLLLTSSMLAWQMQYNNQQHTRQAQANESFYRIQRLATLTFLLSVLLLLVSGWKHTLLSWSNLVLGLLALISTLLPTLQPPTQGQENSHHPLNPLTFSSVHGLLTKASGLFAVLWLFLHLLVTA